MSLLEVRELGLRFGGVKAVDGLSFSVEEGEILAVIGPNGAGKTSAFNCISGFYRATSGAIEFQGRSIMRAQPSQITRLGMARTFQNLRLFKDMTVLENVMTAMHSKLREGAFATLFHLPSYQKAEAECASQARSWLDFVGYTGAVDLYVTQLPYGEQRRVEIARALATSPKLLLLDEPAAGLNHTEKLALSDLIRRIRDLGVAVVLIEHDMGLVMDLAERVVVLNYGREIADGTPAEVQADPRVIEAYLGSEDDGAAVDETTITDTITTTIDTSNQGDRL